MKFKFRDKVRITKGFYTGLEAYIIDIPELKGIFFPKYIHKLNAFSSDGESNAFIKVSEDELEKAN